MNLTTTFNEMPAISNDGNQESEPEAKELSFASSFEVCPFRMGFTAGVNYDDVGSMLEYGEGSYHR